jgi:uncharacterized protein (TIGR03083 family)
MTKAALDAALVSIKQMDDLADRLTDEEWALPSACAGWRVVDVYAHMAALAHNMVEPPPPMDLPANRERQHDVYVDLRRSMTPAEVVAEWREYTPKLVTAYRAMQEEPLSQEEVTVYVLGTYKKHQFANALAFDTLLHLYADVLKPMGPIDRDIPEPGAEQINSAVEWMMAGLPQMQGTELNDTLSTNITIELTGIGGSTWTVGPGGEGGKLLVRSGDFGDGTVVKSDTYEFTKWGTTRTPWRSAATVEGNEEEVTTFLDKLDII